ncbi:MAG: lycopene cyclase family protein [Oceanicaulis sp.]
MALEADIVIAGAGAAGLTLAAALTRPGRQVSVLVLEPRAIAPNPRRWVFPAEPGHALSRHVTASFDQVSLGGADRPLSKVRLHHVEAASIQSEALDQIAASPQARIEEGARIDALVNEPKSVRLETSLGTARARLFVDTRPGAAGSVSGRAWTQIAWIALLPAADGRTPGFTLSPAFAEAGGVGFTQTLILPDGEAVVEAMRLARPGDQGDGLEGRLNAAIVRLGGDPASVMRRRLVCPIRPGERDSLRGAVMHARAGAGGIRFAPGMEALRLARWADAAAARFVERGRMTPPPGHAAPARAAAARILRRLETGPQPAADWLNAVLARSSGDAALRFLAGAPGWRDSPGFIAPARLSA